ncbi:hypothetical protein H113_01036 [Trichophyton rubrum MR1459]|nr:hypothetical protein H113_01036 [Trichophyton rubrum MR1459]EZG10338.1 hypothetical protein H106_00830 [Trichophyton rubrum CBS 735.88]
MFKYHRLKFTGGNVRFMAFTNLQEFLNTVYDVEVAILVELAVIFDVEPALIIKVLVCGLVVLVTAVPCKLVTDEDFSLFPYTTFFPSFRIDNLGLDSIYQGFT